MNQLKRIARRNTIALAIATCLTLGAVNTAAAATPYMGDQAATDSQQPVTDTWITTKVKAELATTGNVSSTDISVDTVDGVVRLTGNTGSDIERKKAIAAARSVKGVKSVDASGLKKMSHAAAMNKDTGHESMAQKSMDHGSKADSQQPVTDTWITTKVKAELATTDNVSSTDISVDTVNGVVHLTGNTGSEIERKKAIAAARSVKGVKSVDASGLKKMSHAAAMNKDTSHESMGQKSMNDGATDHESMDHESKTGSQQPVTDTWITTKVKTELATTDNVDGMDVSVDTINGVVHLTGNTGSDIERNKAIAAARSVKGVKSVDASGLKTTASSMSRNHDMDDESGAGSQQPVTDTWITTKVKTELATTDNVSGTDISVDTVNGVVHLIGNVGSDTERNKAIAAAKSVKGVKKVDASGLKAVQ